MFDTGFTMADVPFKDEQDCYCSYRRVITAGILMYLKSHNLPEHETLRLITQRLETWYNDSSCSQDEYRALITNTERRLFLTDRMYNQLIRLKDCFNMTGAAFFCLCVSLICVMEPDMQILFLQFDNSRTEQQPSLKNALLLYFGGQPSSINNALLNETAAIMERILTPDTASTPAIYMSLTADAWLVNLSFGHWHPVDKWMRQVKFLQLPDPIYFLSEQESMIKRLFQWKNLHTEITEPMHIMSLTGRNGSGKKSLLENISFDTLLTLIYIDCDKAFSDKKFLTLQCNKLIRFCLFSHAVPVFINYDRLPGENIAHMIALIRPCLRIKLMIFLGETDAAVNKYLPQDVIEYSMPEYTQDQQLFFWNQLAQKSFDPQSNGAVLGESFFRAIVLRYSFTPGEIRQLLDTLRPVLCEDAEENQQLLIKFCQQKNSRRLGKLINYLPCSFTWNDIILPQRQLTQLKNIADRLKYFHKVYSEWGFAQKRPYGQGISVLMSGPPGTGKTMAAQVIAAEAGMNLYRVDISTLVDKYIGETQKNISRVFDEAEASKSILLFDEADALFGKRVEQSNANDRYSNQEIACLLQRIEQFTGLCLLTTNISVNIDPAFNRRFKFIINFPSPDPPARLALWKKAIPSKVPSDNDINYEYLSTQFELTGADIKNVVEAACFYAAKSDLKLSMIHIIQALADEIEKSGRAFAKYLLEPYEYIL